MTEYQEKSFEEIIPKFGVENKIISLLKVLNSNFVTKFTVSDVTQSLHCIIGVKQGDILGPILFTFFIAAVMIIWKAYCKIPVCMFCSKINATLTGGSTGLMVNHTPFLTLNTLTTYL